MKEFLEYLDRCEKQANINIGEAQVKLDRYSSQRSTVQDIRTRFLELGGNKEALVARVGSQVWWYSLKEELERRIGPGLALRQGLLESKELSNLYVDTIDQVLQLMTALENGEEL